jgi:drug/metabolite transporter (DMT)-like permease
MDDPACSRSARPLALVAGFAAIYLVWGSTYLGIKFAVETLPPLLMAGTRFVLAGLILYSVLRLRGAPVPTWKQWKGATLTGALLLVGGNGLVTWAQQTVPSGRAALIVATTPLWMVVLGWLLYGGDRPRLRMWLGLAVGFAGAALLIPPSGTSVTGSITGSILLALAPICWSIGSLQTRRTPPTDDPLVTSAMQMLVGGAMMLLLGMALGEVPLLWTHSISQKSVIAFIYLVVAGLVGFSTFTWLMRHASPSAVSTYAYVNPLVAVLLGWLVAGERLEPVMLLAAALVIGAVVLITLPSRQAKPPIESSERQPESTVPAKYATCSR